MMDPSSLLSTCPIHRQCIFMSIVAMTSCLQRDSRSSLEILFWPENTKYSSLVPSMKGGQFGQVLLFQSPALYSIDKYWENTAVIEFHVLTLYCEDFQMLFILMMTFLALLSLFCMSFLLPPSGVMMLPRYTKLSVKGRLWLLTLIGICPMLFRVIISDSFLAELKANL